MDISYGTDRLDPSLVGYFTNATPGAPNAITGAGFGPDVLFSRASGTFLSTLSLALSTTDTNSDIRSVLVTANVPSGSAAVTNIPTATSPLYTDPIPITSTAEVRARTFPRQPGLLPGQPHTESYVRINAAAALFTSDAAGASPLHGQCAPVWDREYERLPEHLPRHLSGRGSLPKTMVGLPPGLH
jgi:hypothetical protein